MTPPETILSHPTLFEIEGNTFMTVHPLKPSEKPSSERRTSFSIHPQIASHELSIVEMAMCNGKMENLCNQNAEYLQSYYNNPTTNEFQLYVFLNESTKLDFKPDILPSIMDGTFFGRLILSNIKLRCEVISDKSDVWVHWILEEGVVV
jgi:hypothetical protein